MLNISIISGNNEIIEEITKYLNPDEVLISNYTSVNSLRNALSDNELFADVVFVETVIDNCNGVKIAEKIKDKLPSAQIIFIALKECSKIDIYDVEHVYALRNGITEEKVKKGISHALKKISLQDDLKFNYKINRKNFFVSQKDIVFFEKDKRKIRIHHINGSTIEFYGTFDEIKGELSNDFVICHNSYLVNINYISSSFKTFLILNEEYEIPISRSYSKQIKTLLAERFSENRFINV